MYRERTGPSFALSCMTSTSELDSSQIERHCSVLMGELTAASRQQRGFAFHHGCRSLRFWVDTLKTHPKRPRVLSDLVPSIFAASCFSHVQESQGQPLEVARLNWLLGRSTGSEHRVLYGNMKQEHMFSRKSRPIVGRVMCYDAVALPDHYASHT